MKLVGITSCPTGIAHTYMAADALAGAADTRDDVEIIIETQGSSGGDKLTQAQIDEADAVIFAHGVGVREIARFAGKPVVDVPVKKGISEPDALIDRAIAASKSDSPPRVSATGDGGSGDGGSGSGDDSENAGWGRRIQQADDRVSTWCPSSPPVVCSWPSASWSAATTWQRLGHRRHRLLPLEHAGRPALRHRCR